MPVTVSIQSYHDFNILTERREETRSRRSPET
jgi:hypothetical protein